jgi:hypothetical protein
MTREMSNFQYVGYLSDFLSIYNEIDTLTQQYECAKKNYDNAQAALLDYKHTFSFVNCLYGFVFVFLCSLITFPLLFIPHVTIISWLLFCAILSCVIIVVSKFIYHKKVLPIHKSNINKATRAAEREYRKAYEALLAQRSNLQRMREGIHEKCVYPLSVYIMREAAKEGSCSNIPQGVNYFLNRYKTLETAEDEASVALKQNIDNEQSKATERQAFLENLDESAQSLFQS